MAATDTYFGDIEASMDLPPKQQYCKACGHITPLKAILHLCVIEMIAMSCISALSADPRGVLDCIVTGKSNLIG